MSTPATKYWAFISYSHQDEAWATWLHRALETYRVPRRLVGRATPAGPVPRRLFPVFRDRDELPSSHELGAVLTRALAESRNLVVVCSPRSATSKWVNEEIKAFRALGRSHRVFCLIVDGEPHASANPEHAFAECFAPALRGDTGFEPIAADARPRKDGKDGAKLKLVAGLLGVGLDELKQREKQRRFWQTVQRTVAAVLVVGLLGGTWQWFSAQRAAREKEILVERLVENGRLELLDGRQARAAVYLNEALKLGHDTVPVRFMLGQAMQPVEALTDVRVRHGGNAVRKAAFSPDGERFVLVVEKEENVAVAKIYDAATGRELAELLNAPPAPRAVRFLSNGALLITGFSDTDENGPVTCIWKQAAPGDPTCLDGFNGRVGEPVTRDGAYFLVAHGAGRIGTIAIGNDRKRGTGLQVYRTSDGLVARSIASEHEISAASFSPDGNRIAIVLADGSIEVWSTTGTRQSRSEPEPGLRLATAVAFAPNGEQIIAVSGHGDVRVWDQHAVLKLAFAADPNWITDFYFDDSGRRFLTVGSEGYKVWSLARGVLLWTLSQRLRPGSSATLSPDGDVAFTADIFSNSVDAWDVLGKRKLYALDYHTSSVTALAMDNVGRRLLLASRDGQATLWRISFKPLWKYQSFETLPYIARFDRSGSLIVAGRGNWTRGDAAVFETGTGAVRETAVHHAGVVFDAAFDASGERFVSASADGIAKIWDVGAGTTQATLDHRPLQVVSGLFSPDGRYVLTTARDYATRTSTIAKLWSRDGRGVATLQHIVPSEIYGNPSSARFDNSSRRVVTSGDDGKVNIWDTADGRLLKTISAHAEAVVSTEFSRTGDHLLTAGLDNTVSVWDIESEQQLFILDEPALALPSRAVWAPDERSVAITSRNGNVWIWNLDTGERRTLKGHSLWAMAPIYLHGGKLLLSYSLDGTVRAWDPVSGSNLGVIASELGALSLADTSTDDSRLITSTWGQMSVWDIAVEHRSADSVEAILNCRSPWSLDPGALGLVQTGMEGVDCAPSSISRK